MEIGEFHKDLENFLYRLQREITDALERSDGNGKFRLDEWRREQGGGGISSIMEGGNVIEKGGVNVSAVFGAAPEFLTKEKEHSVFYGGSVGGLEFYATGLSLVIHPLHPYVPIIHMNIRYFELSDGKWWLGGGIDLTPHYVDVHQACWFHRQLKKHCDAFHPDFYDHFKKWADDYFFLPHRNETRGVGGVFFDRLNESFGLEKKYLFNFWKELGKLFVFVYVPLMEMNKNKPYTEKNRQWQLHRRSRYAEFNLLYDKGTRFGLETGGRTESILMSLPPVTAWKYNLQPEPGSEEEKTILYLKKNISFIALDEDKTYSDGIFR